MLLKLKGIINMLSLAGIRVIVVASTLLGTAMITYGGYSLYEQIYTQNRAFRSGVEQFDTSAQIREAQDSLAEARKDYRAWIRVDDTHIDYPVMQGKDDLYYANHDIDGKSSLTGAIYMSTDNAADMSDNYIVIFGHHMDNGAMFGDLDHFLDASYFAKHQDGLIASPGGSYDLRIFAAMKTDAYDDMIYTAGNRDLDELLAYIGSHASVQKPQEAKGAKKIVALSTCADATTNGRLIVFGVLTPSETPEEPTPSAIPSVSEEPAPTTQPGEPTPTTKPSVTGEPEPTATPSVTTVPVPTEASITKGPIPTVTPGVTGEPVPTTQPSITPEITGEVEPTAVPTEEPASPTPTITEAPSEVTPVPAVTDAPSNPEEPQKSAKKSWWRRFLDWLNPGGSSYDEPWALLNLICLIVTIYIVIPLARLKKKYGRIKAMREANAAKAALWNPAGLTPAQLAEREAIMAVARREQGNTPGEVTQAEFMAAIESRYFGVTRFARRFKIGVVIEAVVAVAAVVTFILTENMRQPMVLIDRWTLLMLLFMILCLVADIRLARYRDKDKE